MSKEQEQKPEITGKEQVKTGREATQFKQGQSGNPNGRPKGKRDFFTDFKEAIKLIKDKQTGKELTEIDIIKKGIEKMWEGQGSQFSNLWISLLDRVYGKPNQTLDLNGNVVNTHIELTEEEKKEMLAIVGHIYDTK